MTGTVAEIRLNASWRYLSGMAFGLRQASLTGELRVRGARRECLARLDERIPEVSDIAEWRVADQPDAARGLAARLVAWTSALHNDCNIPTSTRSWVGEASSPDPEGWVTIPVAVATFNREAARIALPRLTGLMNRLLAESVPDARFAEDLKNLKIALKPFALSGLNSVHFLRAADRGDIPVRRLLNQLFAYGTGRHTRWLNSSVTDRTAQIGVAVAHDKASTAELLRRGGLPAPTHVLCKTVAEAEAAAEKLGYPLVVKPVNQEQGRGVAAGLTENAELREAATAAFKLSKKILVERHVHGRDYRLTVLHGALIKVELRIAGGIEGDGVSTIAALVAREQAAPRLQRIFRQTGKMLLELDDEALAVLRRSGMTPETIPGKDVYVPLRRKNNISSGGRQVGIPLREVHPDNAALAIQAAAQIGLDLAGIDLIIPDIALSWRDGPALICEINAQPQIGVLTSPDIYERILADMMKDGIRVPAHLVITAPDASLPLKEAGSLAGRLQCDSLSLPEGVWRNGQRLQARPLSGIHAAEILLGDRQTNAALCVVPLAEILKTGLPGDSFASIRLHDPSRWATDHPEEISMLRRMAMPHTTSFMVPSAETAPA